PEVRRAAARALALIPAEEATRRKAIPVLLETLAKPGHKNPWVGEDMQFQSALLLRSLLDRGDTEAIPVLVQALKDVSRRIRWEVIQLLRRFGDDAAPAVPVLLDLIGDEELRCGVIETLGAIGPGAREAVPDLVAALQEEG